MPEIEDFVNRIWRFFSNQVKVERVWLIAPNPLTWYYSFKGDIMDFVAIDFETAVHQDSICAVGIVTVEDDKIVDEYHQIIQPPNNRYSIYTTRVHGMTSADTIKSPNFVAVYPEIKKRIQGKTLVAHNESFDRNALKKTMDLNGLNYDELGLAEYWECTKQIYQRKGFFPFDLATLSREHKIELNHHEALSDARACALLYIITNR